MTVLFEVPEIRTASEVRPTMTLRSFALNASFDPSVPMRVLVEDSIEIPVVFTPAATNVFPVLVVPT